MASDLAAQIRATLEAWAQPTVIETTKVLGPAEWAEFITRWVAAHQGPQRNKVAVIPEAGSAPFELMHAALLAVLDDHGPGPTGICRRCVKRPGEPHAFTPYQAGDCPTAHAIATALGIDTGDDTA